MTKKIKNCIIYSPSCRSKPWHS